jgi:hypothetical protein
MPFVCTTPHHTTPHNYTNTPHEELESLEAHRVALLHGADDEALEPVDGQIDHRNAWVLIKTMHRLE